METIAINARVRAVHTCSSGESNILDLFHQTLSVASRMKFNNPCSGLGKCLEAQLVRMVWAVVISSAVERPDSIASHHFSSTIPASSTWSTRGSGLARAPGVEMTLCYPCSTLESLAQRSKA